MTSSVHLSKGQQYDLLHPWLGQGLLTGKGSRWNKHRKLIAPTFHLKILENFMQIIEEKSQILLNILDEKLDGNPHNIYQDITHCALDIICETTMGVNVNAMSDKDNEYIKAIYDISEIIAWKMLRPYIPEFVFNLLPKGRRFNKALDVLHGFSRNVISSRKKLLQSRSTGNFNDVDNLICSKKRLSLLDMLLEASKDGKILNDNDIREEVDTFMFEIMYYLVAVLVTVVLWYLISYYKWWKNVYFYLEKLPGDPRYPIIGTEYIFIGVPREELFNAVIANVDKYAPIFRTWNGSSPEVHLTKPEHLELIMNNSIHITKGQQYANLYPWLGEGLLTSSGSKWYQHRKLITPAFHFKILENFMNVFVEKAEMLLCILDGKADGNVHNIYPDITHCALDIICQTAMGVNVNAMLNKDNEYIKSVYEVSAVFLWRAVRPYVPEFFFNHLLPVGRKFKEDLKVLHRFSNRVIADRRRLLIKGKEQNGCLGNLKEEDIKGMKKRLSFLDLLIEASEGGKVLSDTDIREEVDTFIFEGHDTTTASMCWTLFLLGNHPDIQERAFDEIKNVLHDKQTPTSITELHELKYLECIIKESLRLYPSVPFITRHIKQEIQLDEYRIPADVQAILHIYGVHRNPDHYFNPDQFDPDRFLPKNSINRHPYAYIPFSAGPRNCIGQKFAMYEEKTILASIINRYKVRAVETVQSVKISTDIILRPANGVLVKLEKRKI
ncbi:cytochrome p450 family 4 [Holotrichia oblita]|uniref:Cytochrome p450 family 4 n=1 Tax=Holotrichia oblita TaxID=644536 RepID=A0ACB9TBW1_HOLOL|nr:cytochrome p450 family 4 [Holotrichia oblita]